jgi:hypothetical protein
MLSHVKYIVLRHIKRLTQWLYQFSKLIIMEEGGIGALEVKRWPIVPKFEG